MKLNHECVRDLLLTVEEDMPLNGSADKVTLHKYKRMQRYSEEDIIYTVVKSHEAGHIHASVSKVFNENFVTVYSLTHSGYTFLDNIRNNGI